VTRVSRRRGMVALVTTLTMSVLFTTWLLAGAATVEPLVKDVRRAAARQQALALASAGVEVARADALRGAAPASLAALRLGVGSVDVEVRQDGAELVVRATGRAEAGALLGPGGRIVAVVVARLHEGRIVAWEELP
jgi:hypothetical protein